MYYPSIFWSSFSQRLCDVIFISSGSHWLTNSALQSISGTKILFCLFRLLLIIMNLNFIVSIFSVHNIDNLLNYGTRNLWGICEESEGTREVRLLTCDHFSYWTAQTHLDVYQFLFILSVLKRFARNFSMPHNPWVCRRLQINWMSHYHIGLTFLVQGA